MSSAHVSVCIQTVIRIGIVLGFMAIVMVTRSLGNDSGVHAAPELTMRGWICREVQGLVVHLPLNKDNSVADSLE